MTDRLKTAKQRFINLAIESDVLSFGEFELKSGRISPYFFNAGNFDSGKALAILGECYADAIVESGIQADVLFGPAYKGIPLVAATSAALYQKYQLDYPVCFDRKEAKTHGEGGKIVGSDLKGKRVLILDDVITAGTAVSQVVSLIHENEGTLAGVLVGLDRQEKAVDQNESAIQQLSASHGVPVFSIVDLSDIRSHLTENVLDGDLLKRVDAYRDQYGV